MADGPTLKMKDLEALTDVSREAIHFYLREGLLPEPSRPKRNVALYSQEHVQRIRLIKRLQEERFLPLGEIRKLLDRASLPPVEGSGGLAAFELSVQALLNGDVPEPDRAIGDVAQASGVPEGEIERLVSRGVIRIVDDGEQRCLDFRDAAIVEQWGRLLAAGYADRPGYDADYLARLAQTIEALAEFEVDAFLEGSGRDLNDEAAALATRGIEISNEILVRLRTQALLRRLSAVVSGDGQS
ncbi:MAG: MerR family transcriptional regulator [Pseudomonadales bacterium]|jgi:DNA-binding transcriptional MerR regulator